jgi:hypothetical protein
LKENMREIPRPSISIGAAIVLATNLVVLPAAGSDAAPVAPPSAAMAWVPDAKSKARHVKHVRVHPARVASLARPDCGWSAPCDRQFVLILGIGF